MTSLIHAIDGGTRFAIILSAFRRGPNGAFIAHGSFFDPIMYAWGDHDHPL